MNIIYSEEYIVNTKRSKMLATSPIGNRIAPVRESAFVQSRVGTPRCRSLGRSYFFFRETMGKRQNPYNQDSSLTELRFPHPCSHLPLAKLEVSRTPLQEADLFLYLTLKEAANK